MSGERAVTIFAGLSVALAPARVQAIEKANAVKQLSRERDPQASEGCKTSGIKDDDAASRFGTGAGTPLWNGPRLRAPFVAQILGQEADTGDAYLRAGYRGRPIARGLFVDESV